MSTLARRLKALETVRDRPMKDVREMTDVELLAILAPVFGGRVPTDAELLEFLRRGDDHAAT